MPILFEPDPAVAQATRFAISSDVQVVPTEAALARALDATPLETLVVCGTGVEATVAFELAESQRAQRPALGVILLRKRVDAAVLSQALRSGVREVVKADDLEALADACRRSLTLSRQLLAAADAEPPLGTTVGTVMTVFSAKGGCGKTTLATNLAVSLAADLPGRVCLVDLDLSFGDVGIMLQLFPDHTLADTVTMAGHVDDLGVRSIVTPYTPGRLDTLLAPLEPHDAERIPASVVGDLLNHLKRMYDVVVVDTPPSFTDHVLAALDATDCYLLVATLDIPALKNLKLTIEMLDMLGYPGDQQFVVLNRADAKVGLTVADAERALHRQVACQIPSSRDVPASANRGEPLALVHPSHTVATAVRDLGRRLAPRPDAPLPAADKSRHARRVSLLRRSEMSA